MGDMGDVWRDVREYRRRLRLKYGVSCPWCAELRPNTNPSILLPKQTCKVDGYKDPRPYLTKEQKYEVS